MTRGAQKRTGGLEALDPLVYGSDDAITEMCATYNLGGVTEPSREDLAVMQQGQYILRAHGGRLSKVPAEKTLLPFDPVVNYQQVHAVMGAEGTIYFSHGSTLSKSSDGGRTWSSHELTLAASQNCSFQVLSDGTFVGVRAGGPEDPSRVVVWASGDEGRTWEELSEIDNPVASPVRHADTLCRLPDDTLLLPIESRYDRGLDPNYVHCSMDGGKTWSGPKGPYSSEAVFVEDHWEYAATTGPSFLGCYCHEVMIANMASGKLLAIIRYHGPVVPQWPMIDPGRSVGYKNVFLADSEDRGCTWKNFRQLTHVGGQCHGFGVGLNDGSVVVTHDHRYPPGTPANKAMISHDEGRTWEDEVYYISFGSVPEGQAGFSESVVLEDDTILTIAATTDMAREKYLRASTSGRSTLGSTDVWAIRWRLE